MVQKIRLYISKEFQHKLSKKYLDLAEILPNFGNKTLITIQDIRKRQREGSERAYEQSRPPDSTYSKFLYFRLFELFHVEDFEQLEEGLIRLFPKLKNSVFDNFSVEFRGLSENILGAGGWRYIGRVTKEPRTFGALIHREISKLPEEVTYIEVVLHKILPSIFVITLDVHLTDAATVHLVNLQNKRYLPKGRFLRLIPWKPYPEYSSTTSERAMVHEVLKWIDQLRNQVESCFKPFINGYFMNNSDVQHASLPAIEVYSMQGVPETQHEFEKWESEARRWYESLGFDFFFDYFGDGKQLFTLSRYSIWPENEELRRPRLVVLWEAYLRTIPTDMFGGDDKLAVSHYTTTTLTELLPYLVIIEFLGSAQKKIERLRKLAFERMNTKAQLTKQIRLNDSIHHEKMLMGRIIMEFEQRKERFQHIGETLTEFVYFGFVYKKKEPQALIVESDREKGNWLSKIVSRVAQSLFISKRNPKPNHHSAVVSAIITQNLRDELILMINFRKEFLLQQLLHVTSSFSDYLAIRNMEAVYSLQRTASWTGVIAAVFTAIGLLVAVAGLAATWKEIQTLVNGLLQFF